MTLDLRRLAPLVAARCRMPVSTYRLQFHRGFSFDDAAAVVPYLSDLGVTDCYASPYLKAQPGSTHGYDICDHNALNPELGGEAAYLRLMAVLRDRGMGQVLDVVPNHMGTDPATNPWWRDVLENGPSSPYAAYFDIEWEPVKPELRWKMLLPILGDQYGAVLERGELRLAYDHGALIVWYVEMNLPINPRQAVRVLGDHLDELKAAAPADDPSVREFLSILTALEHLPPYTDADPARRAERQRETAVARERLHRLVESSALIRGHVERVIERANGTPGRPETFDLLHELLESQAYRLAYWRTAGHEINYRRFFDINALAGLRMEDPEVFAGTHRLLLRLIREGHVTGLRLDHPDGLFDPEAYFQRLQAAILGELVAGALDHPDGPTPEQREALTPWLSRPRAEGVPRFFVAAEKILSPGETLPDAWLIHGTSGYDFLNDVNAVFVDAAHAQRFRELYHQLTDKRAPFSIVEYVGKRLIMTTSMASELNVLAHAANRLSEGDRRSRDFTLESLREALRETVACFPVYRTYLSPRGRRPSDSQVILHALAAASRRNPAVEMSIFEFLRQLLLPEGPGERLHFAMRFQQYTGPVQAKGLEDTAFYRYNPLVSLNEVGGDPEQFGIPPAEYHRRCAWRANRWPQTMNTTATHDTKRGEDTRARINVLSELPELWEQHVGRWMELNARYRTTVQGAEAPDRNDEYLLYQTLIGVWSPDARLPDDVRQATIRRIQQYLLKAVKEAKLHTSWVSANRAYDEAVASFVERVLSGPSAAEFLEDVGALLARVAPLGMVNSLGQLLLKLTAPGVCDVYQGGELWDFSLVDPDNRRPVDFELRRSLLDSLKPALDEPLPSARRAALVRELLGQWTDGRIKLYLTALGLRLRRRLAPLFLSGDYVALEAGEGRLEHMAGCARVRAGQAVLAVVPRLSARLTTEQHPLPVGTPSWGATQVFLPDPLGQLRYHNVITGEPVVVHDGPGGRRSLRVAELLAQCPVALLEGAVAG